MSLESEQSVDYKTARKALNTYFSLMAQDWQARQVEALWPTIKTQIAAEHVKGNTLDIRPFLNKLLLKRELPVIGIDE